MKNTIKILGIIAFIVIIGFSMVSCNEDEDNNNSNNLLIGTWIKGEIELSFMTNGWVASLNGQIGDMGESFKYDGKNLVLYQSGGSIKGNATISGNKMTISGFTNEASMLNGVWTKQ